MLIGIFNSNLKHNEILFCQTNNPVLRMKVHGFWSINTWVSVNAQVIFSHASKSCGVLVAYFC